MLPKTKNTSPSTPGPQWSETPTWGTLHIQLPELNSLVRQAFFPRCRARHFGPPRTGTAGEEARLHYGTQTPQSLVARMEEIAYLDCGDVVIGRPKCFSSKTPLSNSRRARSALLSSSSASLRLGFTSSWPLSSLGRPFSKVAQAIPGYIYIYSPEGYLYIEDQGTVGPWCMNSRSPSVSKAR